MKHLYKEIKLFMNIESARNANNENIRHNRPFEVVEYNPNWIHMFEEYKNKLEETLGNNVLDIQHIGSTAIPGMAAKPQIDILVVVRDLDNIKGKYDEMLSLGFQPRGDYTGIGEEYFTEDNKQDVRLVSVHVLPQGHLEIAAQINFRDYLIMHEYDRNLYSATKVDLFRQYPDDYSAYGRGKEEIIKTIRQRADQWARESSEL